MNTYCKPIKFIFLLALISSWSCKESIEKPNVIFVFADQLRSHELSCYGGKNISTPNMDRLANEGLRLTNAISTYPICTPYRGMLMTGSYPMHTGVTNNDHPLQDGLNSIAKAFNEGGYQTAYIGKWHLDGRGRKAYIPEERRMGYQHWEALECTHEYFNSKYYENNNDSIKTWPGYDARAQTHAAIKYLKKRDTSKPVFLMLSWGPPHGPYIAPKKYMDRINPSTLKLRPNVLSSEIADDLKQNPRFNIPQVIPQKYTDPVLAEMKSDSLTRRSYAGYLAATLAIDDYLGELLEAIRAEGLDDNTIIVFTSDHGDQLSSHQLYDKNVPFEESISIPFLIKYPGKIKERSISEVLLEPVDIMPTLLSLADVKCPQVDGEDKSTMLLNPNEDNTEAVLIMNLTHFNNTSLMNGLDTWRGLRTKRYTYARYEDQTPWLLYDNIKDPYQLHNLVNLSQSQPLINEMNHVLDSLLLRAGDNENTKELYDKIISENPKRKLVHRMREENPGKY